MDKITVDLKGADFEKKLVWRTNEGFKVKPFYRQEDLEGLKTTEGLPGQYPYIRGIKKDDNTWFIRQDINVNDAAEANAKALDILNKGVDSLGFHIKAKELNAEYLDTLLKDICCFAYHGVAPQENIIGNEYIINLKLKVDISQAIQTDDVVDTVNYAEIHEAVKAEMSIPSKLLEHVCGRIAKRLLAEFPAIEEIELRLSKRNPPMGADIDSAGVELHCSR